MDIPAPNASSTNIFPPHRMIQNPCFTAELTAGSQSNDPSSQVASEQIQGGKTEIMHFSRKQKSTHF